MREVAFCNRLLADVSNFGAVFKQDLPSCGKMKKGKRKKIVSPAEAILQYADTDRNADQFYFGGFQVPDPFISMKVGPEKIGFFSRLEIGRAGRESAEHVYTQTDIQKMLKDGTWGENKEDVFRAMADGRVKRDRPAEPRFVG